jgi:hypothetical protein
MRLISSRWLKGASVLTLVGLAGLIGLHGNQIFKRFWLGFEPVIPKTLPDGYKLQDSQEVGRVLCLKYEWRSNEPNAHLDYGHFAYLIEAKTEDEAEQALESGVTGAPFRADLSHGLLRLDADYYSRGEGTVDGIGMAFVVTYETLGKTGDLFHFVGLFPTRPLDEN